MFVQIRASLLAIASSEAPLCSMSGLGCQWKPFLDPGEDSFVEECVFISDEPSDGQNTIDVPVLRSTDHSECIPVTPRVSKHST